MFLGTFGIQRVLRIQQGSEFGPVEVLLRNPDGTPVNAAGSIFRGQIRRSVDDAAPAGEFVFEIVNSPSITFRMRLPRSVTDTFEPAPPANNITDRYVWDVEHVDPQGNVRTILYGAAIVQRQVTRV